MNICVCVRAPALSVRIYTYICTYIILKQNIYFVETAECVVSAQDQAR